MPGLGTIASLFTLFAGTVEFAARCVCVVATGLALAQAGAARFIAEVGRSSARTTES